VCVLDGRVWKDAPLSRVLVLKRNSRKTIGTLGEARDLILRLPERHQARQYWLYAAELLLQAGASRKRKDIEEATRQMGRALTAEGWL
jgi:hypothetical protein